MKNLSLLRKVFLFLLIDNSFSSFFFHKFIKTISLSICLFISNLSNKTTQMSHDHTHQNISTVNRAFIIGIILNLAFVLIEVGAGITIHSLSLLSDAGHNLADVAALALSLFVMRMSRVKATDKFTYGYKKTTILAALLNAVILLISIGAIGFEAVHRLFNPEPMPGQIISIIAGIGIVINSFTAFLFIRFKDHDLNIKSAFLHLLSDAVVSVGLVIGGVIIYYTHLYWIDSILSLIIAVVIIVSTWSLLRDSFKLSLDGVPVGINIEHVRTVAKQLDGVIDFHHIHIWALSTTENALTAHLVVSSDTTNEQLQCILKSIKHEFIHLNIHHTTIETEFNNHTCKHIDC